MNRYLYTTVHSSKFIIAKRWKQLRCPTDECINKMILLLKFRDAFLIDGITWINLANTMLSEISYKQKTILYDSTHLFEVK